MVTENPDLCLKAYYPPSLSSFEHDYKRRFRHALKSAIQEYRWNLVDEELQVRPVNHARMNEYIGQMYMCVSVLYDINSPRAYKYLLVYDRVRNYIRGDNLIFANKITWGQGKKGRSGRRTSRSGKLL